MTSLLLLNSSASGDQSVSATLTRHFVDRLRESDGTIEVRERDLGNNPIPHLDPQRLPGLGGKEDTNEARETHTTSNNLIAELKKADILVIGAPMYNFGITSTLKVWFDHVLRAGITFGYTEDGPQGYVTGKRAIIVESRGGFYSEGPGAGMDAQEPHLRAMLGLIGITDVTFVHAERLAVGPEVREASIEQAKAELDLLAEDVGAQTIAA